MRGRASATRRVDHADMVKGGRMPLFEDYRPGTWGEVVGQAKACRKVDVLRRRGLGGRAFWINGQSGTGKTTIARLLAGELADAFNVAEIDAGDLTVARVREIREEMECCALGAKRGRACIVLHCERGAWASLRYRPAPARRA